MDRKTLQTFSYEMYALLRQIRESLWRDVEAFADFRDAMRLYDCIDELFSDMRYVEN